MVPRYQEYIEVMSPLSDLVKVLSPQVRIHIKITHMPQEITEMCTDLKQFPAMITLAGTENFISRFVLRAQRHLYSVEGDVEDSVPLPLHFRTCTHTPRMKSLMTMSDTKKRKMTVSAIQFRLQNGLASGFSSQRNG